MDYEEKIKSNIKNERMVGVVFSIIFILIGLVIFIVCSIGYVKYNQKEAKYVEITGKVIEIKYEIDEEGADYSNLVTFVIEYMVDDVNYQIESSNSRIIRFKGTTVHVKYNPNNPEDAYVAEDTNSGLILVIAGAVLILVGVASCLIVFNKFKDVEKVRKEKVNSSESSITCPHCGAVNSNKNDKCDNCGANLRE